MNTIQLNELKENIMKLETSEMEDIYSILVKHNIKHTKNKNGVFLNMLDLNEESIIKINEIINNYKNTVILQQDRHEELQKYLIKN
jgi:hypothetical protein